MNKIKEYSVLLVISKSTYREKLTLVNRLFTTPIRSLI